MLIERHQVHVWHTTCSPTLDNHVEVELLDARENERANRFRNALHRERYIHAHILLRQILARYLPVDAKSIHFDKTTQGKPFITYPNTKLQFNLSHSDNAFVCAIHPTKALGIDIEKIKSPIELAIAKRYFTEQEYELLASCSDAERPSTFCYLWASKEAIVKAAGTGLLSSLKQFSITPHEVSQNVMFANQQWLLISRAIVPGFHTVLACDPAITHVIYHHINNQHIITQDFFLGKNT